MNKYHKIQTVYLRDSDNHFKTLLDGQFALPEFEYLKNNKWVFTEKVDGTNIRLKTCAFGHSIPQYFIEGKTDKAQIPPFLLEKLTELMDDRLKEMWEMFDVSSNVCFYGEGYGARIQKGGGNYRSDVGFVLFDIKIGDWWLQRKDVDDIAKKLNMDIVPIIGKGTLNDMVEKTKKGFKSIWGDFQAEGIVARPLTELAARNGKRIITKIKNKDFSND